LKDIKGANLALKGKFDVCLTIPGKVIEIKDKMPYSKHQVE